MQRLRLKAKNKMPDFQPDVAEFEVIEISSEDAAAELKVTYYYKQ